MAPAPGPSWGQLAAYAGPALPLAALTLPLYVILPSYYAGAIGLPLAQVGFILLIVRLADAISDPLVGLAADRFHPPLGRRRGWLALAALPAALAAFMILTPPDGAGWVYLLGWGLALSLGYTAAIIPYTAWGAELADDYHGRSRVAGAREGMVLVGTLVAISVPALVEASGAGNQGDALAVLAWLVALALPLTVMLAIRALPEPAEPARALPGLRQGLAHLAANRPFVRLLIAFVVNGFANGLPATLFLFFVARVLEAPQMQGPFLFLYFFCGIAGVPLWIAVSKRLGKHRSWSFAMLGACAIFALVPLLGPGDLVGFAAICVLTGLALGADLALPSAIQADVIDVDRLATGSRRSGLYFALWGLATKLSLALAVGLAFPLLDLAGFAAEGTGDGGLVMLVALYALVPVALKLVAIALMWNFPLDAGAHAELARSLAARDKAPGRPLP
ncbi:MFS transporter [Stappia indica]|uniref:MFS transporter n=1 Tax=Stappia indica TaxID=538381 RepID=UPI001D18D1F2|nr:MFS transporter [Stappia indica]MCC4246390.1 MFS transporter [Stappia indica]